MARTKTTHATPAPGAGVIFALRAIGLVLFVRWLHAMVQMGWSTLSTMASSPWACVNLVFLFLLLSLPGASARAERPRHPLPQWLRQALRFFALLGLLFAVWSVGAFTWSAGWHGALQAVVASNGWLIAAPVLYAAVVWICRSQPLWRTNIAARRYAIGRYAISVDVPTRTVAVWMESRKVGQYDARELAIRWPRGTVLPPAVVAPMADAVSEPVPAVPNVAGERLGVPEMADMPRGRPFARPKVELLWDSPAAVGHNRKIVMRASLSSDGDRAAARAFDAALRQFG